MGILEELAAQAAAKHAATATVKPKPPRDALGRIVPGGGSLNPGGQGSGQAMEKRAFLERMRSDDADTIYSAFMDLVREGNTSAVIRAVEYIAGRPKEQIEISTPPIELVNFDSLTVEELEVMERIMLKARGGAPAAAAVVEGEIVTVSE